MNRRPESREVVIRQGCLEDISAVATIEQLSFDDPWPLLALRPELESDQRRRPLVVEVDGRIQGYLMAWVVADEYHIVNIAVRPEGRRGGFGSLLLEEGLDEARDAGCVLATLEVRRSNTPAIEFYRRWGFKEVGCRRGYYADNGEDALILTCRI
jgi:[ribosomal protein S18]-alanine N-acetyltransferase